MILQRETLVNFVLLQKLRENGNTNGTMHSILLPKYVLHLLLTYYKATGRVTMLHLMGFERL